MSKATPSWFIFSKIRCTLPPVASDNAPSYAQMTAGNPPNHPRALRAMTTAWVAGTAATIDWTWASVSAP